jgi:hypothetical protein
MTTLGTLTLELSAPTANLAADLKRAEQMVKDTAQAWRVKPVWGIAASLHDEMRATRSIFNSGMRAIESDALGYSPKIKVGVDIDREAINRDLAALSQEFSARVLELRVEGFEGIKAQIENLNQQRIVMTVDDKALTALNAHLTLKEQHLNSVVARFASTKITPVVDDPQLVELHQHLTVTEGHLDRVVSKFANTRIMPITAEVQFDEGQVKNAYRQIVLESEVVVRSAESNRGKKNIQVNEPGIISGLYQEAGRNVARTISSALRRNFGFDTKKAADAMADKIATPVKIFITENPELKASIKRTGDLIEDRLRRSGYVVGEAIIAGLEASNVTIKQRSKSY